MATASAVVLVATAFGVELVAAAVGVELVATDMGVAAAGGSTSTISATGSRVKRAFFRMDVGVNGRGELVVWDGSKSNRRRGSGGGA